MKKARDQSRVQNKKWTENEIHGFSVIAKKKMEFHGTSSKYGP